MGVFCGDCCTLTCVAAALGGLLLLYILKQLILGAGSARVEKQSPTANDDISFFQSSPANRATCDRKVAVDIDLSKAGPAARKPVTINDLFKQVGTGPKANLPALRSEQDFMGQDGTFAKSSYPRDSWKTWTWGQYYNESVMVAKAFQALGMQRFDAVNIYGFNSPQWFMAEMGCILGGGIAAGIYPSDTGAQVTFKSSHSGASIAAVQGLKQAKVFLDNLKDLPKIKAIVVWDQQTDRAELKQLESAADRKIHVVHWNDLAELASDASLTLEEKIQPGSCCAYIYTSGTTGDPKAVMMSHDNLIFEASGVATLVPELADSGTQERVVSYLPLSHVAGMMVDIILPIVHTHDTSPNCHVVAHFARNTDLSKGTLGNRLRCVQPTFFLGVPRVWEKISEKMKAMGKATKGAKLAIAKWCKGKGLEHALNCELGRSGNKPAFYGIAQKMVLSKVKKALGLDECKYGFTGAAPISKDTLGYFGALGIGINEVYGMSECAGATTISTDAAHVWGSCGFAMRGTEVKVFQVDDKNNNDKKECPTAADIFNPKDAEQGEICFRGRHIMMGYMANPDLGADHMAKITKKTNDAIDADGWLHSGDQGCISDTGMLRITGRFKELIIGAGGENIAPVPIENGAKKRCPAIANIMMVGDKRKFNVALITLKAEGASGEAPGTDVLTAEGQAGFPVKTISGACKDDKFIQMITDALIANNKDGSVCCNSASKIQKFTILPRDFSIMTGELTATLKLKRSVVDKKHKKMVDSMYQSKDVYVPYFGPV